MKQADFFDLDWVAFLYVADELSDAERVDFEEQLFEDQAAREAVARAVELTQTLAAARELDEISSQRKSTVELASPHRNAWSLPAAWVGAVAAACLAVVAVLTFVPSFWPTAVPNSSNSVQRNQPPAPQTAHDLELAAAWTSAREGLHEVDSWWEEMVDQVQQLLSDSPLVGLLEDGDDDEHAATVADVPTWMVSALECESAPESEPTPEAESETKAESETGGE